MRVDFGGLFFLALVWAFFKLVSRSREASSQAPARRQDPGGLDPLQDPPKEGRALRMLLRELERVGHVPGEAMGRRTGRGAAPAGDVEDRTVLEVAPVAESRERDPARGERAAVDQDDEAEQVIARRAAAAASRSRRQRQVDQQKPDIRPPQEPADHTATRALTPQQLRDAIVWREILGPPVSERDR